MHRESNSLSAKPIERHIEAMKFSDYNRPTGRYIATGERILPLDSAEGMAALGHSAMLSALGTGPDADRYQQGMKKALEAARRLDLEASGTRR